MRRVETCSRPYQAAKPGFVGGSPGIFILRSFQHTGLTEQQWSSVVLHQQPLFSQLWSPGAAKMAGRRGRRAARPAGRAEIAVERPASGNVPFPWKESPCPLPAPALGRLAAFVVRRRRAVVLAWVAALVAAFGAMGLAGDWAADYNTPGSESKAAADLLAERFPAPLAGHRRRRLAGPRRSDRRRGDGARRPAPGRRRRAPGHRRRRGRRTRTSRRDGSIAVARLPLTEPPGAVPVAPARRSLHLADRARARRACTCGSAATWSRTRSRAPISSEAVGLAIAAGVLLITLRHARGRRPAAGRRAVRPRASRRRSSACSPR